MLVCPAPPGPPTFLTEHSSGLGFLSLRILQLRLMYHKMNEVTRRSKKIGRGKDRNWKSDRTRRSKKAGLRAHERSEKGEKNSFLVAWQIPSQPTKACPLIPRSLHVASQWLDMGQSWPHFCHATYYTALLTLCMCACICVPMCVCLFTVNACAHVCVSLTVAGKDSMKIAPLSLSTSWWRTANSNLKLNSSLSNFSQQCWLAASCIQS